MQYAGADGATVGSEGNGALDIELRVAPGNYVIRQGSSYKQQSIINTIFKKCKHHYLPLKNPADHHQFIRHFLKIRAEYHINIANKAVFHHLTLSLHKQFQLFN